MPNPDTTSQLHYTQGGYSRSNMTAQVWTFDQLPSEFHSIPNVVCWRYEDVHGRKTKVPYRPNWGQLKAKAGHPDTWGPFAQAQAVLSKGLYTGLGFNLYPYGTVIQDSRWEFQPDGTKKKASFIRDLTPNEIAQYQKNVTDRDGFQLVGIDLDHCVSEQGQLADWAENILHTMGSYSEVSPSGTGLRIFAYGTLPPYGRRHGAIEMYTSGRFLTLTGHRLEDAPMTIAVNPDGIAAVHAQYIDKPRKAYQPRKSVWGQPSTYAPVGSRPWGTQSDQWIAYHIGKSANAAKFSALWHGSIAGYPESQNEPGKSSEADLAFCSIVAFWTGDGYQIDRLYRQSGLMRSKWAERSDYREMTINLALGEVR